MPELNHTDHSEEVQDILGHIPHWIIRWGISVLFGTFFMVLVGSYFFKYPEKIDTPLYITTLNAPAPIVALRNGRIANWSVSEKQRVERGQIVALLRSEDSFEDLLRLETLLDSTRAEKGMEAVMDMNLPSLMVELRTFEGTRKALVNHLASQSHLKEIGRIESDAQRKREYLDQMQQQRQLKKREFAILEAKFLQDSTYYVDGSYGITKSDYDNLLLTFIREKSAYIQYEASFGQNEEELEKLTQRVEEVRTQYHQKTSELRSALNTVVFELRQAISAWRERYIIQSPARGVITLPNYWSTNQVVTAGDLLATVVPEAETEVVCRAFVGSQALGKIEIGQKVVIKLDGFPYLEYGTLEGKVSSVALVPVEGKYLVEIDLPDGTTTTYGRDLPLVQQMTGLAEIITSERRLLYKLVGRLERAGQ